MSNDYDSNGIIIPLTSNPGTGYVQIINPNDGTLLNLWLTYDQASRGFYCTRGLEYRLLQYKDQQGYFCTFHNNEQVAAQSYVTNQITENNNTYVSNTVVNQVSQTIGVDPTQLTSVLQMVGNINTNITNLQNTVSTLNSSISSDENNVNSLLIRLTTAENTIGNLVTIIKNLSILNIGNNSFTRGLI